MNHKQAHPHRADFARRRFRRQDPKPGAQELVGGVMTGPSPVAAEHVADLKFRRAVERLHNLGPRATAELLAEIGAERSRSIATPISLLKPSRRPAATSFGRCRCGRSSDDD